MFQHTAARRRLGFFKKLWQRQNGFNTQPPEGGWRYCQGSLSDSSSFNTQPPEGGWLYQVRRPLLARLFQHTAARRRLETCMSWIVWPSGFNTQPPEGGWAHSLSTFFAKSVSTHSRPKAAGNPRKIKGYAIAVSTHSRPKAAGRHWKLMNTELTVSTHSRPKAAGTSNLSNWTK